MGRKGRVGRCGWMGRRGRVGRRGWVGRKGRVGRRGWMGVRLRVLSLLLLLLVGPLLRFLTPRTPSFLPLRGPTL